MFRFTQKPSSENSPVLRWNYQYGLSVLVGIDVVSVMAAYQPVVQACGTLTNEHWKKIPVDLCRKWTLALIFMNNERL